MSRLRTYIFILFLLFNFETFAQNSWDPTPVKQKPRLPKFTASIDSLICNNETIKGKTVFINFWYAACSPCISELDALNSLYKKLYGTKNFEFLSFTFESSDVIEMLIDKYDIKYPVFSLPKEDIKKMNQGRGFPSSIIVDPNGFITYIRIGGSSDTKQAKKIVMSEVYPAILKSL